MSSHYTTVSCAEWEHMQEVIADEESYKVQSQEELARLEALNAQYRNEMEQVRQATRRTIDAAQDYLSMTYRSTSSSLSEQIRSQLNTQADGFSAQINQMRAAASDLSARGAAAADAIDQLAIDFNKAVSALLDSQPHEEARTKRTLEELDKLLAQLRSLNPGGQNLTSLGTLESKRAAAASNIESGNYQAALILTQGSILTASRTLASAIVERERFAAELYKVQSSFSTLQAKIDALSSSEGTISYDIGEDSFECEYDINFWSHGLFGELTKQAASIGEAIQTASNAPADSGQLHEIAGHIRTLQARLEACDKEARRDLAGTLALENTVQRLYTGLEERGWAVESSGHQDDDARKPYAMTCTDGAGNTVSIVGAGGERPEMPSFFYEAFADSDGMADLVKGSIAATLQAEGINIESDVERNDCAGNASPESFVERISNESAQAAARRRTAVRNEVNAAR